MKPLFTHAEERHDHAPTPAHSPQPTAHSPQRFERWLRRLGSPGVSLFLASALVACGGGGDGGSTTPTPTPSNPATGIVTANGCVVMDDNASCNATASWATQNASSPRLSSGGATISTLAAGSATFAVPLGTSAVAISNGNTVLASVNVVAACGASSLAVNGVCKSNPSAWWPPATITPIGVKVYGASPIPAGCTSWYQQCWKDLVRNGEVKFIETPQVMTGINSRPIVFAFYRNASGLWNTLPTYRDTGELVGSDIFGGISQEYDWAQGTAHGIIIHEKASGDCYEKAYYPPTTQPGVPSAIWDVKRVSCP